MDFSPQDRLINLHAFQRRNVEQKGNYDMLSFTDLKRIDLYINGNIFGNECCLWNGEFNSRNYSVTSFQGNKVSILRLLYHNYVDDLDEKDRLKYLCENKKKCCCLNHFTIDLTNKDSSRTD